MRKFIVPVAGASLLAAMSIANAADANGVIKSIDTSKDTITLASGATYSAPSSVKLSGFKVGEKVDITYTMSSGKMEISAVKPAA